MASSSIDTIVVCDTETTGMDPAEGAALLEVAWVVLDRRAGVWQYGEAAAFYVEHEGAIPAEARAVHHISPEDVRPGADNALPRGNIVSSMLGAETPELCYAYHNAAFDTKFLPELKKPALCTYRASMHIYPTAPRHGNQVLRYWMNAEPPAHLLAGLAPHRALYDAAVTAAVLLRMLDSHSAEELVRLSGEPILLDTVRFGKHKGAKWSELPRDYLRWLRDKSDMCREDRDVDHTVRHYLG
jgi:exodeoxyribonuclease X